MEQITLDEATAHLSDLVDRVRQTGQPVTLTKQGEPYADLVPHQPAPPRMTMAEAMAALDGIRPALPKITSDEIRSAITEGRR